MIVSAHSTETSLAQRRMTSDHTSRQHLMAPHPNRNPTTGFRVIASSPRKKCRSKLSILRCLWNFQVQRRGRALLFCKNNHRILMSRYPEFFSRTSPKNTSGLIKNLAKIIRISTIALCMCIYIYIHINVTHIYVHMIDFHSNVTNATWKLLSQDFSASGGFWWKQWLDVYV